MIFKQISSSDRQYIGATVLRKILIFGNSGSGKSTLAREISSSSMFAHLDLDTLAWALTKPPERMPLEISKRKINTFVASNEEWVIEGCYTDLLELAIHESSEIVFMNLSIESCIANAKSRPWEPHKYESKEAQDANLNMLIDWIAQYSERDDTFSESTHNRLYESCSGKKCIVTKNGQYK